MKEHETQCEIDRDSQSRFSAEQYVSNGYGFHLHRNMEIYGVVHGEACVTIGQETRVLRDGEIAVVNSLERHRYQIETEAEIFYFHIGIKYLRLFNSVFGDSRLPHFLTDTVYNASIYSLIADFFHPAEEPSELVKNGTVCLLLDRIIKHYGIAEKGFAGTGYDLIEKVVQYIYEHYAEELTLNSLARQFCVTPNYLSKRLSQYIGIDLRIFINDIRTEKAMQMLDDPAYSGKSLREISALCGFQCVETFYKVRKRNYSYQPLPETEHQS